MMFEASRDSNNKNAQDGLRRGKRDPQMHTSNTDAEWLQTPARKPRGHLNQSRQVTSSEIRKFAELCEPYAAILWLGNLSDAEFVSHLDNFQQNGQILELWLHILISCFSVDGENQVRE